MYDASNIWHSGYSQSVPFVITLDDGSEIVCDEVVRAIPGRRYVCRGKWHDQVVFIKLFANNSRARRECENEQQGISTLLEADIPAPTLLLSSQLTQPAARLLIYAALENPESSRERWEHESDEGRHLLLQELVELLARHHASGLQQKDLHLRNFLYSDSVLYTLDAADIEINADELDTQTSLNNLAALFALLKPEYDKWVSELYTYYCQRRSWRVVAEDKETLLRSVQSQRTYKQNKFLDKIFRNCTAFVAQKTWRQLHVYDREYDNESFQAFINHPDLDTERTMIKAGNTCTVTSLRLGPHELVCKRYNIKHFWHGLNRAIRPTRASQSWRSAHRLLMHGIATPKPVALIERRFGPLRGVAWFIMQKVDGRSAHDFFRADDVSNEEKVSMAEQFANILLIMQREQISHGDMKATNFLINDGQLVVLDLDALCQHSQQSTFERAFQRDIRRFLQNWQDLSALSTLFRSSFINAGLQDYLPSE